MFSQKNWLIACHDCNCKLLLGSNTLLNLVDAKGAIIEKGYRALDELIEFAEKLEISFPVIPQVKAFVDRHKGHNLQIAPDIDDDFRAFAEIPKAADPEVKTLHAECRTCSQSCVFSAALHQNSGINEKRLSVSDLELFNQLFELYHELGCRIKDQRIMLDLERILIFFKKHAGHQLCCSAR